MKLDTTKHYDYTDAARKALAADLVLIARHAEFDAARHEKNTDSLVAEFHAHPDASELLTEAQAIRDTARFKRAKAAQAHVLADQLRRDPGDVTLDDRAGMLTWLAQQANARQIDADRLAALVAGWSPGVDGNQRGPLFDDLCEAVKKRDGIETGTIDWRTASDVTGIGGRDRALDLAHGEVDAALWPLTHPGEARCVDCVGRNAHPRPATVDGRCDYHHERRQLDAKHAGSAA